MKKNLVLILVLTVIGSLLLTPLGVNAEINSAEERIIAVVSGNYKYDGKKYKITDEYQAQVREYLDRPDINFTDAEVSEYIATFYNNIGTGIDEGYLEEVKSSNKNDKDDNNAENSDNNNENTSESTEPQPTPTPDGTVSSDTVSTDSVSADSVSEDEVVMEIDPNMNYSVSDNGAVSAEEKPEDAGQATLEELAEEYSVEVDKIKELQDEIEQEQEEIEIADPYSEEELDAILTGGKASAEPAPEESEKPETEETPEPVVSESPQPVAEEKSSGAGIVFAIVAGVLAVGAGVVVFIRKKKA